MDGEASEKEAAPSEEKVEGERSEGEAKEGERSEGKTKETEESPATNIANDEKVEETKEDAGDEVKEEVYQALSGPEEHIYH